MSNPKTKSPWLSVFLTMLVPGLGQMYSGLWIRGLLLWFAVIGITFKEFEFFIFSHYETVPWWLFLSLAFLWLLVLADAYRCAVRYNRLMGLDPKDGHARVERVTLPITAGALIMVAAVAYSVRENIGQLYRMPTTSMADTLKPGDKFFADRRIYKYSQPQRGDVLVFKNPRNLKIMYVKRLVAKGGDTVEIRDGKVYVNGLVFQKGPMERVYYLNQGAFGGAGQPVVVPPDSYYVLGDNSRASNDSRHWGFVPAKYVIGKAFKIYFPFERAGEIR